MPAEENKMYYPELNNFTEELLGKTLVNIKGEVGGDEIVMTTSEGEIYKLFHSQDCCEDVRIEDIVGDLNDLLDTPLLMADEAASKNEHPADIKTIPSQDDSFTWTFYKLATVKGYVTLRWFGTSNGYYSERVSFVEQKEKK